MKKILGMIALAVLFAVSIGMQSASAASRHHDYYNHHHHHHYRHHRHSWDRPSW